MKSKKKKTSLVGCKPGRMRPTNRIMLGQERTEKYINSSIRELGKEGRPVFTQGETTPRRCLFFSLSVLMAVLSSSGGKEGDTSLTKSFPFQLGT